MGKSFRSNATKYPTPGSTLLSILTIDISSPNETLQSFINVVASPKIHVPVTAAIIRFNHTRVTLRRIHKPLGESPHIVSVNIPFLVKGTKNVSFVSLH